LTRTGDYRDPTVFKETVRALNSTAYIPAEKKCLNVAAISSVQRYVGEIRSPVTDAIAILQTRNEQSGLFQNVFSA